MSGERKALELLDDVLALPAQERSAYLDAACADQPGLRELVASLLLAVEDATGMLPDPPEGGAAFSDAKTVRLSLSVGQRLAGRYEVVRVVGIGGMGEVYQAIDLSLGRDVAIKVLRAEAAGDGLMGEQFERELKSVALLSHPNVVTLYDVADQGQLRFAVMEFVAGQTLRQRMSSTIGWRELVGIAYGVASGLNAAHSSGIVHRDIKPANIIVMDGGHAKILDFGIARRVRTSADQTIASVEGSGIGTIPYMSPEQVNRQPLTFATDLFSLGVVLYEALAGKHPFRADTASQTMRSITDVTPDVANAFAQPVPAEMSSLIEAMLGKEPGQRPSAMQVVQGLRGMLDGHRPAAPMGSFGSDAPTRMDQAQATAASHALRVDGPPAIAVLPFETRTADLACQSFGDAVAQDLIVGLSRLRWLPVIARGSSFRFRGPGIDLADAGRALGAKYLLTGSLEIDRRRSVLSVELCGVSDMRVIWAERYEQALEDIMQYRFDVPLEILGAIEAGVQRTEAERCAGQPSDSLGAWSAYHRGLNHMFRFKAADNQEAAHLFEQAIKQDPSFARAHAGLSFTHFQNAFLNLSGDFDEQCTLARRTADRAAEIDPLDPFINLTLGRAGWLEGDLESAGAWTNQSLQLNPSYAFARYNRALIDVMLSDAQASERNIDQALRLSPIDPMSYAMHATNCMSRMLREDYEGAAACAQQAVRQPAAHVHAFATATIAHQLAGNHRRAAELAALIKQKQPSYSAQDYFRSFPFRASQAVSRMRDALKRSLS